MLYPIIKSPVDSEDGVDTAVEVADRGAALQGAVQRMYGKDEYSQNRQTHTHTSPAAAADTQINYRTDFVKCSLLQLPSIWRIRVRCQTVSESSGFIYNIYPVIPECQCGITYIYNQCMTGST